MNTKMCFYIYNECLKWSGVTCMPYFIITWQRDNENKYKNKRTKGDVQKIAYKTHLLGLIFKSSESLKRRADDVGIESKSQCPRSKSKFSQWVKVMEVCDSVDKKHLDGRDFFGFFTHTHTRHRQITVFKVNIWSHLLPISFPNVSQWLQY